MGEAFRRTIERGSENRYRRIHAPIVADFPAGASFRTVLSNQNRTEVRIGTYDNDQSGGINQTTNRYKKEEYPEHHFMPCPFHDKLPFSNQLRYAIYS
jgi:hypothetical protein